MRWAELTEIDATDALEIWLLESGARGLMIPSYFPPARHQPKGPGGVIVSEG